MPHRSVYKVLANRQRRAITKDSAEQLIMDYNHCSVYSSIKEIDTANLDFTQSIVLYQRKRAFEYEVWTK